MKIKKGEAGYIDKRKKKAFIKATLEFGIVIALLILGIVQTGSRLNLLTLVAILGCLPAAKALVELIMLIPHHSIETSVAEEIEQKTESLTKAYDLVLTSENHIMPIDCVVICKNTIYGYTSSKKTDTVFAITHIKNILQANEFSNVSIKIFDNYKTFLLIAEGLHNIATVEKADTKEYEEAIRNVILNISL